jgi:chromosome segregation ATPase
MPKGKGRRRKANVDWESSGAEDSISNEAGSDGSTNGVGERGNANDSGHRIDHTRDGGPSKGKRGGLSQHKSKDSLGPWTEAVSQVVQNMEATHQAIHTLQEIFTSHSDNIEMIEQTRRRAKELEGACEEKDEKIRTQEAVIFALRNFDQKAKAEAAEAAAKVKEGKQSLDQEKKKLEDDRAKLEKRVTAAIAEEKLSLNLEAKKYEAQLSKIHEKREKERDDEFAQRKDENDKRAAATETERKRLSATVEEQQRIIDARSDELKRIKDQHDLLDRATDSYKRDLKDQEKELKLMKEEFALNSKSKDYLYVFYPFNH